MIYVIKLSKSLLRRLLVSTEVNRQTELQSNVSHIESLDNQGSSQQFGVGGRRDVVSWYIYYPEY